MEKEHINLVFVGHVDHGKSTLIGRLLYDTKSLPEGIMEEVQKTSEEMNIEPEFAYILDSLEEERAQNVTIDTTQIFFKNKEKEYTIIDAPGHKEFLKNMITGASQADAAILMIDAKEGVKEQTKKHAQILSLLGIKQVIVAVNKMDSITYNQETFNKITTEINEFLANLKITPTYIIPISAKLGENIAKTSENMSWYSKETILEALDTLKPQKRYSESKLIMPVQDVYKINEERIIVGTIISGKMAKEQEITFYPSEKKSKIEKILNFPNEQENAISGESIGIKITDPLFIERGEIISENQPPRITDEFNATIFWMDKKNISLKDKIELKCSTQETLAEIKEIYTILDASSLEKIDKQSISESEIAHVRIKTSKPIIVENFSVTPELGRFVLEKEDIVGCGVIILE